MKKIQITVTNEVGLHARPASIFVQTAQQFKSKISLRNITGDSDPSDAKSILGILVLGIEKNHQVEIVVDGDDEDKAISTLHTLVESDFQQTLPNE